MNLLRELCSVWPWRMALRDARRSTIRLLASAATISLGVAVLVAVGSLSQEVGDAVRAESKGLLGADLSIRARGDWTRLIDQRVAALGDVPGRELARQIQLTTVASFPKSGAVRQARVRAIEGNYPWYGTLETAPPTALEALRAGTGALVDESLIRFSGAAIGDPIRIGTHELPIAGAVVKVPGETATNALFGARVYVPLAALDPSLLDRGSRVERSAFLKVATGEDPERVRSDLATFAGDNALNVNTARSVESNWNRSADRLHDYLHLAALAALLLGGLGVGSAMHLHARRKREVVATLRCLGAAANRAFAAFAAQALMLGAIGTLAGALVGIAVHRFLPRLFADFLPIALTGKVSLSGLAGGCAIGIGFALLAALYPLSRLRHVPPADALRASTLGRAATIRSTGSFLLALFAVITFFGWLETGRARTSFEYATFFFAGGGVLVITGMLVVALARIIANRALPFGWRYAIANLRRPDNQTPVLLVTLGLGALILATIDQTEAQLYATIDRATSGVRPNLVFFDVQRDQVADVKARIAEHGAPLLDDVPVITMRLAALEGRSIADLRKDRNARIASWALGREYRSTYRDQLTDTEETVGGEFPLATPAPEGGPFPISLEDDIARQLDLEIGDTVTWDVQGIAIETRVAHLRRVEWQRLSPNFFAVFPTAALADAPQFRILTARAADAAAIAAIQRAVADQHPGVSSVDVGVVLEVADDLLGKIGLVLRAMGFICLVSGGLVLLGAWLGTRRERMVESALLRALGAPSAFVRKIAIIEAAALGIVAAITGASLGVGATYLLAEHRFDVPFELASGRLVALMAGVATFGVLTAALAGRGVHRAPPLEVLRED